MSGGRSTESRPGRLRLLEEQDLDQRYVGWLAPDGQGVGSLVNHKGWAMLRVVVEMLKENRYQEAYDQVLIIENPGAVVACRLDDRIGLVQNFRFVGRRLFEAGADYIRLLDERGCLNQLLNELGEWQWELPRGLAPQSFDSSDLERFVIQTAQGEALEESGLTIENPRLLGQINVNTTFFAHPQYAVGADIVSIGTNQPEELEMIGQTRLFTAPEIRCMANSGEITDGLTLATLSLIGFNF